MPDGTCTHGTVTPGQPPPRPGWVTLSPQASPGAGNALRAADGCWSLTHQLANTSNPSSRCPCCWWHLWEPSWDQSRSCFPGGSMGIPPGPISELFYMGVAQLHPANPALLLAPRQQLLPTLGCFPPLLLFGSRELFWSWDVNTEAGPTAGRSDTGQVVSSVRAEISGGSRVLLPPENTSLGSRCSARGRGSMGGSHGAEPTLCSWVRQARSQARFPQRTGVLLILES